MASNSTNFWFPPGNVGSQRAVQPAFQPQGCGCQLLDVHRAVRVTIEHALLIPDSTDEKTVNSQVQRMVALRIVLHLLGQVLAESDRQIVRQGQTRITHQPCAHQKRDFRFLAAHRNHILLLSVSFSFPSGIIP